MRNVIAAVWACEVTHENVGDVGGEGVTKQTVVRWVVDVDGRADGLRHGESGEMSQR